MFRPLYQADYYRDQDNDHDVLPLRWIPWEVYIMVRFSEPNFQPPMMPPQGLSFSEIMRVFLLQLNQMGNIDSEQHTKLLFSISSIL